MIEKANDLYHKAICDHREKGVHNPHHQIATLLDSPWVNFFIRPYTFLQNMIQNLIRCPILAVVA